MSNTAPQEHPKRPLLSATVALVAGGAGVTIADGIGKKIARVRRGCRSVPTRLIGWLPTEAQRRPAKMGDNVIDDPLFSRSYVA
jgi:hypothetical protein